MNRDKKLLISMIIGCGVIVGLSTMWHFIYGWITVTPMALIAPVNESPWEHVKMFFAPAIIFYIFEYFFIGNKFKNYVFARGVALITMPIMMFSMFYGYRDLLHIPEKLTYDIIVTVISIVLGSIIAYKITKSKKDYTAFTKVTPITIMILFVTYAILTYYQPKTPLFYDRNFDGYGINTEGHNHHDDEHNDDEHNEDEHNNDH